jgi:hypothetical protein|tara:strand:+ start:907 stop:1116 length:210 start_codon:yes stop_codon:yes gene_type:complete
MISKQKRNLINELSFWLMREVEQVNDSTRPPIEKKTNIKTLIHIIKSSKNYTNKQIKILINDIKFELPF